MIGFAQPRASQFWGACIVEPASPLVLTKEQHALIGELIEIMGQVDDIMIQTVRRLLDVNRAAANKIMGSTRSADNANIWAHVIRNRVADADMENLVALATAEINDVAQLRNDFIHSLFTGDYAAPGYFQPGVQATSATRNKSGSTRPTSELEQARDRAAGLSCLVAHIDHLTKGGEDRGQSPWRERLGSLLQARQKSQKSPHQEKVRKPPREPSQA
jgi:hypothetical protein